MRRTLNDVSEAIVDCEHKTALAGDGYALSVGTRAMKDGRLVIDACKPVSESTYEEWTRRMRPQPGDLVLAREAPVGQVIRVPGALRICLGQRTVLIRPDAGKVHPRFLHYWLLGPTAQGTMSAQASGATVPHLNVEDIRSLSIVELPADPAVQQFAAELLGSLDDLIENNRRRIELLEQMAQAIYREWFVHFRYPGHENVPLVDSPLGPIPDGWRCRDLRQVIELHYGKALKKDARRGGPVAVLGSSGIVGWHDEELVDGPSIIVGRKGNVGSVIWVDGPSWPIDTTYYVTTDLPLRYVVEQLRRTEFLNTHAAVPGLSREQAYSRPFLQPPEEIMASFSERSEVLASQATAIATQSERLASIRDLLLPKLVTGQIDVSELDLGDLVESVA